MTTTTTTTAATTAGSGDDFEPVDGGVDRVCRGATPTDNALSYFNAVYATSLQACKQHGVATGGCKGIDVFLPDRFEPQANSTSMAECGELFHIQSAGST